MADTKAKEGHIPVDAAYDSRIPGDAGSINVPASIPDDKINDSDYLRKIVDTYLDARYGPKQPVKTPKLPALDTYKGMRIIPPTKGSATERFTSGVGDSAIGLLDSLIIKNETTQSEPIPDYVKKQGIFAVNKWMSEHPLTDEDRQSNNPSLALTDIPIIGDIDRLQRGDVAGELGSLVPVAVLGGGKLASESPALRSKIAGGMEAARDAPASRSTIPGALGFGLGTEVAGKLGWPVPWATGGVPAGVLASKVIPFIKGALGTKAEGPWIPTRVTNMFEKPLDAEWADQPDWKTGKKFEATKPQLPPPEGYVKGANFEGQVPPRVFHMEPEMKSTAPPVTPTELPPGVGSRSGEAIPLAPAERVPGTGRFGPKGTKAVREQFYGTKPVKVPNAEKPVSTPSSELPKSPEEVGKTLAPQTRQEQLRGKEQPQVTKEQLDKLESKPVTKNNVTAMKPSKTSDILTELNKNPKASIADLRKATGLEDSEFDKQALQLYKENKIAMDPVRPKDIKANDPNTVKAGDREHYSTISLNKPTKATKPVTKITVQDTKEVMQKAEDALANKKGKETKSENAPSTQSESQGPKEKLSKDISRTEIYEIAKSLGITPTPLARHLMDEGYDVESSKYGDNWGKLRGTVNKEGYIPRDKVNEELKKRGKGLF
jgi:hypothetical protein